MIYFSEFSASYRMYCSVSCSDSHFFAALLVENGKFLLSAKRTRRTTCTEYVISMDADNISRSSSTYIGKLRYRWGDSICSVLVRHNGFKLVKNVQICHLDSWIKWPSNHCSIPSFIRKIHGSHFRALLKTNVLFLLKGLVEVFFIMVSALIEHY